VLSDGAIGLTALLEATSLNIDAYVIVGCVGDTTTMHTCCRQGFRIKIGFTKWKLIIKIYNRLDY